MAICVRFNLCCTGQGLLLSATCPRLAGPHTFQRYEAWQLPVLAPAPAEALKLLHRLAADPGIVGIMQKHRWVSALLPDNRCHPQTLLALGNIWNC